MGYLEDSFKKLQEKYPGTRQIGIMRDKDGVYAYNITAPSGRQYFFCAKATMNGNQVSCHEPLVQEALRGRIPILMWVKGTPYRIYAQDIYRVEHELNVKDRARMINFPLWEVGQDITRLGEKPPVATEPQPGPQPTLFDQDLTTTDKTPILEQPGDQTTTR